MMTSNSNPTPQKGQEIENSPERNPCPEIPDPAFEQASIIRNAPSGDEFIFVKLWLEKICDGDIDAALMLQGIINVCDLNPERVEGVEVYVDMHLLSSSPFGVRGNDGEIVSRLNKLQSLGLIDVRQIPETERLARDGIRAAFGTSAEGIESAKRYLQMMGPALGIRLEVNLVEQRVEEACEFKVPRRKRLLLPGKSSRGARSGTPKPATCPMVIGDDGQKSRVEGKFAVKGAQR
ncbi:MAG: hypothetical protein WCP68_24495 [Enhydrobacter sp.]